MNISEKSNWKENDTIGFKKIKRNGVVQPLKGK
jgi:hypothetical protein